MCHNYLTRSIDASVKVEIGFFPTASQMWTSLHSQFTQSNDARETYLHYVLSTMCHGDISILEHLSKLHCYWVKLDIMLPELTAIYQQWLARVERQKTEETKNAEKGGPMAMISSVSLSLFIGWAYLIGITFAVTNISYLLSSDNDAGGYAIAEVFYLTFKNRFGSGVGGIFCLGIVAVALFFCGISSVTSNSRITYAFSRDGAMPLSTVWCRVNRQDVRVNAVWLSVVIAFCVALTSLGSIVAFQAMASITTIGLYIAYALPILFRVTLGSRSFIRGPFNLGVYGVLIGWLSVLWVATITLLFSLPIAYPITRDTFNYTPIAVGGVLILTLTSWITSARFWFRGPLNNLEV